MLEYGTPVKRCYVGKEFKEAMDLPGLVDIQLNSFESFLQRETLKKGKKVKNQGLEEVFRTIFPIESTQKCPDNQDVPQLVLEYVNYELDEENIKYSQIECKKKGLSYAIPVKATIDLNFNEIGEIRRKSIYMGDIPLMTERGTFIVNGAERVVVSQIHRSPGVIFSYEDNVFSSRIIPYRGSWLEFEIDSKKDLIFAKIERKKKILGTLFLRALGFDTREKIIDLFYTTEPVKIYKKIEDNKNIVNRYLAKTVYVEKNDEKVILYKAGDKLHQHDIAELIEFGINQIELIDFESEDSLNSKIIINCFEREEIKFTPDDSVNGEPSKVNALEAVYSVLNQGEQYQSAEDFEKDLNTMFFSLKRYDLGRVGRYKLDKKFDYKEFCEEPVLLKQDVIETMKYLIKVSIGDAGIDDIDHLGNRRIRSVGELLANSLKTAFSRMEKIAKDKMTLKDGIEDIKPQDIISIKPIVASINEFFGSSQLSQFMDQINPLSELTHKRRLSALGPGGLSRDRAGFDVRDVHYTHYGRICPIETPEGPNIGLIVSLANYTKVNDYGFLETPYQKIENGVLTGEIDYLSAMDEDKYSIAQANAVLDENGNMVEKFVSCRRRGDYIFKEPKDVQYMDVSPKQVISIATSLIPFLEHDDANRALMGSNMQRQAVPLLFLEPPRVGTGMEAKTAYDSGVIVKAKNTGVVTNVTASKIEIKLNKPVNGVEVDSYDLLKYTRTNQDTCFNQRPFVKIGQSVKAGDVIADGQSTMGGELALGKNILVGFVPWNGYNYEDAILVNENIVKDDKFTSVHIKEFSIEVRETKLGSEEITRDIPNVGEKAIENLDAEGIIRIGASVGSGDILVGKVTPKADADSTPEFKLLNSIFGEKAKEKKDSSLRVPHGSQGIVIDVQRLSRANGDDLAPGVDEVVKVLLGVKRRLREGDKMAGRHGNKGVISRILPQEDMPYMADGTPLDICLNPLGVPSRMNLGQLLETELGWAGVKLDEWYSTPVFQSATIDQIKAKLKEAGLPESSKITLYDGKTGEAFKNDVFVGYMYMIKLNHLVDDKMHARSTGPYSLVSQQPLGGKAQFGGQRLGEMEVWALEAYGAANTLQELMTIKSDDMNGRASIYESIVKGTPKSSADVPEAFNVLVQELRGLALDIVIYDSKGKLVPLTERDQELIDKQESDF